jgi:hypothetical protein
MCGWSSGGLQERDQPLGAESARILWAGVARENLGEIGLSIAENNLIGPG